MGFNDINLQVSGPQQPASIYKTKVLKGQVPFATQVTEPNTKYVIKHNFVLNSNVTIPENCILEFDGGSISGAYTITGQNTGIEAIKVSIFSQNITLSGVFDVNAIYPEWFGAVKGNTVDSADAIQAALDNAYAIGLSVEFDTQYKINKAVSAGFKNIIFNNTKLLTNVKRDFALSLQANAGNEDTFCEIRGNVALINQDTTFEEINQTVTYPATATVPVNTVESINPSSVPYTDFTIQDAKVGDLVYIKKGSESDFIRFSGEVISDNTVRIYVNNHNFSNLPIEDTEIEVKILSGCCHGINIGGSFAQTGHLRCVKYTGLSFGLGSGLDEECGIRYKAASKVYYSKMNVNLFPVGGIGFRCAGRNNVNAITLSIFSAPYSTSNWPHTYAYTGLSLSGVGNIFDNLSVEGTYHDYAISLGLALGCNLKNIYTEFATSGTYPNGKPLYIAAYASGNRLSYCYGGAIQDTDTKGFDNIIEKKPSYYVNTNLTTMNFSECNMLRDVTFEKGMLTSGTGQYGRWYSWGANCAFSKVDGPIPFTKALRIDATNGRLLLQQRIKWDANNVNDLANISTDICFSFWCRGNIGVLAGVISGGFKSSNGQSLADEKWHLVKCPVKYFGSYIQADIRWSPDTQKTGYAEIFNPRLTLGSNTTGMIDDSVLHELDNHGTTRPINVPIGHCFLDETLGKPIWYTGTGWVDATGATV